MRMEKNTKHPGCHAQIIEFSKWFYRSFINYPSLKALVRIVCFEIPILRRKIWLSRRFVIEIADD